MRLAKRSSRFALAGLILVPTIHVAGTCRSDHRDPPPALSIPNETGPGSTGALPNDEQELINHNETRTFELKVQLGETVGDYVSWTQIPAGEWYKMLEIKSARHLQAGRTHTIELTLAQFTSIQTARAERKVNLRERFYSKYHVTGTRTHQVRRGESTSLIAAKAKIPVWLLVEANPDKDIAILYPGMALAVPTIADGPTPASDQLSAEDVNEPSTQPAPEPEPEDVPPPKWSEPMDLPEQAPVLTITVKEGETLGLLAALAEVPLSKVISANNLTNPNKVGSGALLKLPIPPQKWASFLHKRQSRELLREASRAYRRRGFEIRTIKIARGDTARGVTLKLRGELAALHLLNPGVDLDQLQPGDEIRVAVPTDHSQLN